MSSENPYRLNIDQVQKYLPHRAPFLLIDRVLEIHPLGDLKDMSPKDKVGVKVVALKNVTYNEPCFQGHFPGFSIMRRACCSSRSWRRRRASRFILTS